MKTRRNLLCLLALTLTLILSMIILFNINAYGKSDASFREADGYEEEYKTAIKECLSGKGIKSPGITVTKVKISEDDITVNIKIHLPSYINYNDEEKEELISELKTLDPGAYGISPMISFS